MDDEIVKLPNPGIRSNNTHEIWARELGEKILALQKDHCIAHKRDLDASRIAAIRHAVARGGFRLVVRRRVGITYLWLGPPAMNQDEHQQFRK